jgi:hypothetical protein
LVPRPKEVWHLVISPDGTQAITAEGSNGVRVWNLSTGSAIHHLKEHDHPIARIAISPDGRLVAGCEYGRFSDPTNQRIHLWNMKTGEKVRDFKGHQGAIQGIDFSPDGRQLLSGCMGAIAKGYWRGPDQSIRLWDVASGKELHRFDGNYGSVRSVAFSPDGRFALSASGDKKLHLWRLPKFSNGKVTEVTKPIEPKPSKPVVTKTVGRSPEEIAQRRQEYLDLHLKPLKEGKVEDVPATKYAAQFPPNVKTQRSLSTKGMQVKYFADMECTKLVQPEAATGGKINYTEVYYDDSGNRRQVKSYNKHVMVEGSLGCAMARYWYNKQGKRVQESFFGTDDKPGENRELVVVAHHAYEGDLEVETRYYDTKDKPAEDRFGVHRRVFRDGKDDLEYRLDGSHRQRWLEPLNLGKRINQDGATHASITPDGRELYFSTNHSAHRLTERQGIYRSLWTGSRWSDAEPVHAAGKKILAMRPSISADGTLMAVQAWKNNPWGRYAEIADLPNHRFADIYITQRKNGEWQALRNAGTAVNPYDEQGGAAFVPGTKDLVVASSRSGNGTTLHASKLWMSKRRGNEWSDPEPLTIGFGICPAFSVDGQRLLFSSWRKGSYGLDDIWVAKRLGSGWSRPMNLGPEINKGVHNTRSHDSHPSVSSDESIIYFDRGIRDWNLYVTGRTDSEIAIRHMAEIYALNEAQQPGPPVEAPSLADAKSISDLASYSSAENTTKARPKPAKPKPADRTPKKVTYTFENKTSLDDFSLQGRYRIYREKGGGLEFFKPGKNLPDGNSSATSVKQFSYPLIVDIDAKCESGGVYDLWPGLFNTIRFVWGDDFNSHTQLWIGPKHRTLQQHIPIIPGKLHHIRFEIDKQRRLTITVDDEKKPRVRETIDKSVDLGGPIVLEGGLGHVIYKKVVITPGKR